MKSRIYAIILVFIISSALLLSFQNCSYVESNRSNGEIDSNINPDGHP
jgi:hypothetical protein